MREEIAQIKLDIGDILSGYAERCIEINGQDIKGFQLNVEAILSLLRQRIEGIKLTDDEIFCIDATDEDLELLERFGNAQVCNHYRNIAKAQLQKILKELK